MFNGGLDLLIRQRGVRLGLDVPVSSARLNIHNIVVASHR